LFQVRSGRSVYLSVEGLVSGLSFSRRKPGLTGRPAAVKYG